MTIVRLYARRVSSFVPRQPAAPATPPPRRTPAHRWQRRSSPLARYAALAYALIVIDASLYPFSGWRDLGIGPFDYLGAAWPRQTYPFDLIVNACGYGPLGFLAGLALHPRLRGMWAVLVATLGCVALSIALEAMQTYLPTRVASNVDVASNLAGALLGALCAARLAHMLLDTGRLRMSRSRWFAADASRGLVLVLVWFGALVYPDTFVFGSGGLLKAMEPDWSMRLAAFAGLANDADLASNAQHFLLAEIMVSASMLVGAGLLLVGLLRPAVGPWHRIGLVVLFVLATVVVKGAAHAFLFDSAPVWPPLTEGARSGVALGTLALLVAAFLPWRLRWCLGLAALVAALVVVNVYPDNPYGTAVGLTWTRGRLMNFYGLASGVDLVWPFLAIVYLLRHRAVPPRDPRAIRRERRRTA